MIEVQDPGLKVQDRLQVKGSSSQNKKYVLKERLLEYSRLVIRISKNMPRDIECEIIRRQLTRSACSVGANYTEADGSISKKDFINKVSIARKEAKESKYWIQVASGSYVSTEKADYLNKKADEIIRILSSIIINHQNRNI